MVISSSFLGLKSNLFKGQLDKFLQLKLLIEGTQSFILLILGCCHVGQTLDYLTCLCVSH